MKIKFILVSFPERKQIEIRRWKILGGGERDMRERVSPNGLAAK